MPVACVFDSARWLNPDIEQTIKDAGIEIFDVQKKSVKLIIAENHFNTYYSPLPVLKDYSNLGCRVKCTIHGPRALELGYDKMMWRYKCKTSF